MSNSEEVTTYQQHVDANNERLQHIAADLTTPTGFDRGCRELLFWCSDQRAFNTHFEDNLILGLQTVVDNASKDGFSHELAAELMAQCHTHRKHLSKGGAARINRWHEQFRRQKRNAKKKKKALEDAALLKDDQNNTGCAVTVVEVPSEPCASMWQGGPMPGPSPINSPSYPMGQFPQGYGAPMTSPGMPGYPMDPSGARPGPGYPDQAMMYDQNALAFYQNNPAAAQQQQQIMMMRHQQMQMRQQQQYQHQQRMMQAQAHARAAAAAQGMTAPPHYDPSMFPTSGGVPMATSRVPGQVRSMVPYPQPQSNGMVGTQGMPSPAYPSPSGAAGTQMIRAGPPMLYSQLQQGGGQQQVVAYPNPSHPPEVTRDRNAVVALIKEYILRPFTLEHAASTSKFNFTITKEIFQQLQANVVDIQLKCYHIQDNKKAAAWPTMQSTINDAVQIIVNEQTVPIRNTKASLSLKPPIVLSGMNTVEFSVLQCVCTTSPLQCSHSHLFVIQLVQPVQVGVITNDIITRSLSPLSHERCRDKLKMMAAQILGGARVSMVDEKTRRRIIIPARSTKCMHPACFDMEALLASHLDNTVYECPIASCKVLFMMGDIEVDHFLGVVFKDYFMKSINTLEIVIDHNGGHRPAQPEPESRKRSAQEVDQGSMAGAIKRIKSEPFGNAIKNEPVGSPYGMGPTSVPNPFAASPAHSLMSPYNAHTTASPTKIPASSPAPGRYAGGPVTPATPSQLIGNPSSVGLPQGTSPHQTQQQSHGSVETASVAGSAPYTPASSVGSSTNHAVSSIESQPFSNIVNTSTTSIDFDNLDLVVNTAMSAADLQRYLSDEPVFEDRKNQKDDEATIEQLDDRWIDIQHIISADSR